MWRGLNPDWGKKRVLTFFFETFRVHILKMANDKGGDREWQKMQ